MKGSRTINTVITTSITIALLVGCSSAQTSSPNSDLVDPTSPSPSPTATVAQTQPDAQHPVEVLSVIDPVTMVVTPTQESDEFYGTEFTLHIVDIIAPSPTECGYEETLAFAQELVPEWGWTVQYMDLADKIWIDENGDHYGYLGANFTYGQHLVRAGLATVPKTGSYMGTVQEAAQAEGKGHWTTCADHEPWSIPYVPPTA